VPAPRLTLYSRDECHLCEEMVAALRRLQESVPFELEIVDVDAAPGPAARFGADVPVLVHDGVELCRHRMDAARVVEYLSRDGRPDRC